MSNIPSSSAAVAATRPAFTAAYAHRRATRSAARLCAGSQVVTVPCGPCKGTGTLTFTIETIGETSSILRNGSSSIPCIHCKDGKVDPLKQTYERLIWCQCRQRSTSGFLWAADGRRVFGNDTYLCGSCGFVKQFG